MGIMHFSGRQDLFVIVAFCAILPVLHQHRGWTHWKITPWMIALFLAVVQEYFHAQQRSFGGFSSGNVLELLETLLDFCSSMRCGSLHASFS